MKHNETLAKETIHEKITENKFEIRLYKKNNFKKKCTNKKTKQRGHANVKLVTFLERIKACNTRVATSEDLYLRRNLILPNLNGSIERIKLEGMLKKR